MVRRIFWLMFLALLPVFAWTQAANEALVDQVIGVEVPAYFEKGEFSRIFDTLTALQRKLEQDGATDLIVTTINYKSYYAERCNRLDTYYQALLEMEVFLAKHPNLDNYQSYVIENQMSIGRYFYDVGDWTRSLEKLQQAEVGLLSVSFLFEDADRKWTNLQTVNTTIGALYCKIGDYDAAFNYYMKSLEFAKSRGNSATKAPDIAVAYKHLGDLFTQKKAYTKALAYYQQAKVTCLTAGPVPANIQVRLRSDLTTTLLEIGKLYRLKGELPQSVAALQAAEQVDAHDPQLDHELWYNYAQTYAAQNDFVRAHTYFDLSMAARRTIFGQKHFKIAEIYTALGDLWRQENQREKALAAYQESIIALSDDFTDTDIAKNPMTFVRTFVSKELPGVFDRKIALLLELHAKNPVPSHLSAAWNAALAAINVLELLKNGPIKAQEDKLQLMTESFSIYECALHIAAMQGPDYTEAAFSIMEKSKAVVLLESFKNANALHVAGIPDHLLEREKQLRYQLASLEDQQFRASKQSNGSATLQTKLTNIKLEYRQLVDSLEKQYPAYYALKYAPQTITSTIIRQELLDGEQALMEYFVGDKYFYIVVVSKKQTVLREFRLDFPITEWVQGLRSGIFDYQLAAAPTDSLFERCKDQYAQYAYSLFQKMVAPVADLLPEKIIVIPDGALGYVPFDALLKHPFTNFQSASYLVRDHAISYAYSATLLRDMHKESNSNRNLEAFAPSFPDKSRNVATLSGLDTLFYNQSEVWAICNTLGDSALVLTGAAATKTQFVQHAPLFGIIHIASHGVLNSDAADYSYVAFAGATQNDQDNRLYVRDLYNMRLQAAMVVLSACETALGRMQRGEGIISLSRGFAYAGAQSIVATLWAVNDTATTRIMRDFYRNLKKGQTKDEALRAAKLHYLDGQQVALSTPFFWAAFTPIGNMEPLYHNQRWLLLGAMGGLIAAAIGSWLAWRFLSKQRQPA